MSHDDFRVFFLKLLDYLEAENIPSVTIYWQGGEVLTLSPEWFLKANDFILAEAGKRSIHVHNELQTNLIGYGPKWRDVLRDMFRNELGSSLDYPNLYRKAGGKGPEAYNELWLEKYRLAREDGVSVGIITLPNAASLKRGAAEFYAFYTEVVGLQGFQVNSPFPPPGAEKKLPLDADAYVRFSLDLVDLWLEQGYEDGIGMGPFVGILGYFRTGDPSLLLCGMQPDCSRGFFCVGPTGNVSQCDCWVTSYPDFSFGNVFSDATLKDILDGPVRKRFESRPIEIVRCEDCIDCEFLSVCHGGCAIRTYSTLGEFSRKDPYCFKYKAVFGRLQRAARSLAASNAERRIAATVRGRPFQRV